MSDKIIAELQKQIDGLHEILEQIYYERNKSTEIMTVVENEEHYLYIRMLDIKINEIRIKIRGLEDKIKNIAQPITLNKGQQSFITSIEFNIENLLAN